MKPSRRGTWNELRKAGLLLASLLIVGLPSAALGFEMSGALGRASVSFLPTPVSALLTAPGFTRFACAANNSNYTFASQCEVPIEACPTLVSGCPACTAAGHQVLHAVI